MTKFSQLPGDPGPIISDQKAADGSLLPTEQESRIAKIIEMAVRQELMAYGQDVYDEIISSTNCDNQSADGSPLIPYTPAQAASWGPETSENRTCPQNDIKLDVFESQNWRCCYCGAKLRAPHPIEDEYLFAKRYDIPTKSRKYRRHIILTEIQATIEHLDRKCDGGSDDRDNLVAACGYCNHRREHHHPMVWYEQIQWEIETGIHPYGVKAK